MDPEEARRRLTRYTERYRRQISIAPPLTYTSAERALRACIRELDRVENVDLNVDAHYPFYVRVWKLLAETRFFSDGTRLGDCLAFAAQRAMTEPVAARTRMVELADYYRLVKRLM